MMSSVLDYITFLYLVRVNSYCMTEEEFKPIVKVEVTALQCSKCGHIWQPNNENKLPGTCPNYFCRSPNWNKPKGYRKPFTWKNPELRSSIRRKAQSI